MAVKIRLKKTGRRNVNSFRIVVTDIRSSRDGDVLERVGTYLPEFPEEGKQLVVNADRVKHWLALGARPSETVASLLKRAGVQVPRKPAKTSKSEDQK